MFPMPIKKFTEEYPYLNPSLIIGAEMGFKSRTGEHFLKVKTMDNKIFIKTVAPNGIVSNECIEIPPYSSKEERDNLIYYLKTSRGLIQDDIADYLGISQGTVSNVLKRIDVR